MIGEFKCWMELDVRHVAANAIASSSLIRMESSAVVTAVTLLVIEIRVIAERVAVCRMAGCAGEFSR